MGCCPWANAVSCPSGFACCPGGTTCRLISGSGYASVYSCDAPGGPSVTSKCPCKPGAPLKPSSTLKNVLIIGDSLSIGYTPAVAKNLSDIAFVQHAPWDTSDGGAEESEYMDQCLEFWTAHPSGIPFVPDVVWFNSGMHNVMINGTGVPGQGGNASAYGPFLKSATSRLVAWAAANKVKLIYAWTTPMLNSVSADGIITDILNPAAGAIMKSFGIPQVDLHKPIIDYCGPVPQASCFGETGCWSPHCPPGYSWLATNYIAPVIRAALSTP